VPELPPRQGIDFVLIDPATLTTTSNVATIKSPAGSEVGGLIRRSTAVVGSSFLTTYEMTFHTSTTPGSATFACERI
jgi:hypothetical protein